MSQNETEEDKEPGIIEKNGEPISQVELTHMISKLSLDQLDCFKKILKNTESIFWIMSRLTKIEKNLNTGSNIK